MRKFSEFWRGSVRDFWKTGKAGFVLFLISLFFTIYSSIALDYEIEKGWKGHESVQNVLKDISAFIPVGAAFVGMIVGGIDLMMLLSDWYLNRQEKRIQAAKMEAKAEGIAEGKAVGIAEGKAVGKAEGIAEGKAVGIAEGKAVGIAEGIAEGKAVGKAEVYREILEWDRRRREAEARGEAFTEPPPGTPQNGSE